MKITKDQIMRFFSIHLIEVIFLCVSLMLGYYVFSLKLNMDDNVHIFPSVLHKYLEHFVGYTRDYGLLRPLALVFFYIIYSIYLVSPAIAHLVPFAAQVISGYLIYSLLRKRLDIRVSMLLGLLYIVFPFFIEQYGWLAASNATLANLTLILMLHIVEMNRIRLNKKVMFITILQSIGVLLYENVFFTGIAVAYILSRSEKFEVRTWKFIKSFLVINLPSLLYFITRTFILKPHAPSFAREMSGSRILTEDGMLHVISNIRSLFETLSYIFTAEGVRNEYWIKNFAQGLEILSSSWLLVSLLNLLIFFFAVFFISQKGYKIYSDEPKQDTDWISDVKIWLIISFLSFLPALLLSMIAFPFRVIALPIYFIIVGLVILITKYSKNISLAIVLILVIFSFASSVNILNQNKLVSQDDELSYIKIVESIERKRPGNNKVELIIKDMPNSSRTSFVFGQYLASCVSSDWCLQAALNRRTDRISKITVNPTEVLFTSPQAIIFKYNPQNNSVDLIE
ncbi:MAG: hypothetical protein U0525_05200 [Patescibacteria group bacterium]